MAGARRSRDPVRGLRETVDWQADDSWQPKLDIQDRCRKTMLRLRDPCANFPKADFQRGMADLADAASRPNGSEAQLATFAKSRDLAARRKMYAA